MHTLRTRLACQSLESRTTPAVLELTVDTAADVVDPADGLTSLREAVAGANTQTAYSGTVIRFAPALAGGTLTVLTGLPSVAGESAFELTGGRPVTIQGSGQKITRDATTDFRLFTVGPSASLALRDVELTNGRAAIGGAVYNLGTFTATACTFANNAASAPGGFPFRSGLGGAIYTRGGAVTLTNCTVTGNRADGRFVGRTFIGGAGGGIYNVDGTVTLNHVTVADNTADRGTGQQVYSGQEAGTAALRIDHSILSQAGGHTQVVTGVPRTELLNGSALVVEHPGSSGVGNLVRGSYGFAGQVILTVSPRLLPLADNGGPTRTRGLAPDSPAIDAAGLTLVDQADQTGAVFPRRSGSLVDLGAFEFRGVSERPVPPVFVGSGPGSPPQVRKFDTAGRLTDAFAPFDPAFAGGVRVAKADFNRDGVPDVVAAAGPGGGPHVRVFDGRSGAELLSVFAFAPAFAGGVSVAAAADLTGDGVADLVCGAGAGGGPHVRVLDGATGAEVRSFFAYDPTFRGGVNVAYANDRIVTGAGAGGGPHVKSFDAAGAEVRSFFALDPGFRGGVSVAAGDAYHHPYLREPNILMGAGAGSQVRMTAGLTGDVQLDVVAFDPSFAGGVSVAMADVTGDGMVDLIVGSGPGDPPRVRVLSGQSIGQTATELLAFTPFADPFRSGVFVG